MLPEPNYISSNSNSLDQPIRMKYDFSSGLDAIWVAILDDTNLYRYSASLALWAKYWSLYLYMLIGKIVALDFHFAVLRIYFNLLANRASYQI